ncbi:MAG TPA: hypothetical protein DCG47_13520 [Spirochaetaceae bacterium]|nr:hypothetical protein [Spirochaetaceae bacterium]
MKLLFYSGGTTGSGHIVKGLSIANAIRRAGLDWDYKILSVRTPFAGLAERQGVAIETIDAEDEKRLGPELWRESALFKAIDAYNPDVLVVDLFWFALDSFIRELPCKKAILIRQVDPAFFAMRTAERALCFRPEDYDLAAAIEPGFNTPFASERLEPLVVRHRDEIMPAGRALRELGLDPDDQACFFGFNGNAWEGAEVWKSFDYLEGEGWKVVRSNNREGGLFPAVDWFNAFGLLVVGAGYNAFWEARYFGKEAFFAPFPRNFEDQYRRIRLCSSYVPKENGADQLIRRIAGM